MTLRPAQFIWTEDEVFAPLPRFAQLCRNQFVVGETYALKTVDGIPGASRAAFFATISDIWDNLNGPDNPFPSPEHLRKRALVGAGWAHHSQIIMDTPKDARKFAEGLRRADEYMVIRLSGAVVDYYVAKSISPGAIHADDWKRIKPLALDWAARQVNSTGQEAEQHNREGGAS